MHPATGQPPGNNEQEAAPSLQRFGNLLPPHYRPASIALDIVPSNITPAHQASHWLATWQHRTAGTLCSQVSRQQHIAANLCPSVAAKRTDIFHVDGAKSKHRFGASAQQFRCNKHLQTVYQAFTKQGG